MGCLNIIEESRKEMPTAEVKDLLKTALVSGSHMTNLLDNILQIAMNKYLSHSLKIESFDYYSLGSEIVQSLKSLALNSQISFNAEILPKTGRIGVQADRTKVIQIVSNLINNAIKFSPGGNIDVRFQLTQSLRGLINKWSLHPSTTAASSLLVKRQCTTPLAMYDTTFPNFPNPRRNSGFSSLSKTTDAE
jgi:light-regulated signal transduction histidine kinase (bacteriophytochrome)